VTDPAVDGVPPALFELESEVMLEVWRIAGEVTVREVMDALNERSEKQRKYTTIMTIMRRLDAKGLLARRRVGKTDIYLAVRDAEQYAQARARAQVGALVEEFGDVALVHFAKQMARLEPARREQLRRLARRA
jgi:predicted transcriptional regulator